MGTRGARVREARAYEARETPAAKQRVDAKREVATPFSFPFSFIWVMCKCVCKAPVGDILDQFKCCRVFVYPGIFFYCLSFVCL